MELFCFFFLNKKMTRKSIHALVALILFILSMNMYLLMASSGISFIEEYTFNLDDLRWWFGINCIFLVVNLVISLCLMVTEKLQFNCFILSLISIAVFQLFVTLNSVGMTPNPYIYLICFDTATLLSLLVLSKYDYNISGD